MVVVAGEYCPAALTDSVIVKEGKRLAEVLQVNRFVGLWS